jgi:hypothetical protein
LSMLPFTCATLFEPLSPAPWRKTINGRGPLAACGGTYNRPGSDGSEKLMKSLKLAADESAAPLANNDRPQSTAKQNRICLGSHAVDREDRVDKLIADDLSIDQRLQV